MTFAIGTTTSSMTHGATLLAGSPDRYVDGQAVMRLGDPIYCPIHGLNSIITVMVTQETDGKPVGHVSAVARCGATVITGSTDCYVG